MAGRLAAAILSLGLGAAGIVIAILLLRSEPSPPVSAAVSASSEPVASTPVAGGRVPTPTHPGFPSPPPGALVLAREAGTRALGLAIVPAALRSLVRVSVLTQAGGGARGLDVSVVASGRASALLACGPGCYQAEVPTQRLRGRVSVRLGAQGYGFALPSTLRRPDGSAIVAHAGAVWNHLTTLVWHERLAASPTVVLHTVYKAVAPDTLSYTIQGQSSSIIIGRVRFDRATPTGPWVRSTQDPPIRQPVPFWATPITDARILGTATVAGRPVWVVSFFDPETAAWFEARIDKANGRTLRLRMVAVAHFMQHVYGPFDAPIHLRPPAA
jgi:hypothetical protein